MLIIFQMGMQTSLKVLNIENQISA